MENPFLIMNFCKKTHEYIKLVELVLGIEILWCDQLLGVFVQKLSLMEKASPLFVNHLHHRISIPINNLNNILVCLHTIHHEPFKNECTQPFLLNNCV
jgi:hypothetical protein